MEMVRARVRVYGRVQGVFFRYNTRRRALELGLKGWVRNVPDGTVEILVEGPRDKVERLIDWARVGPPLAKVTKVDVQWEDYRGEFDSFEIVY